MIKVPLNKGLKIGGVDFKEATVRRLNAGEILQLHEASEKIIHVGDEVHLVPSPNLYARNALMKQVSIGSLKELNEETLSKLDDVDLDLLQNAQNDLSDAQDQAFKAVTRTGRSDSQGEDSGQPDHLVDDAALPQLEQVGADGAQSITTV